MGEIQFMGFIYPCIDQLANHASRLRNRTQGRMSCPMVLRTPCGAGIRAPEHHSESTEAMLAHIPGLRVVVASSPERAYGLLLAAIRDPDPVVFLEPTRLYRSAKGQVEDHGEALPLNVAFVLMEGRDVTLVSWGAMLKETLATAEELAAEGISAEVIDLATLKPYDEETILISVAKTGRCVIVHEAARTGGFGAEIAAVIAERGLTSLLAPIARVTGYDTVLPLPRLEQHYMPSVSRIAAAARRYASSPEASEAGVRQFLLPDIGEGLGEAEIVAWHVTQGDHVVADQPLVSVETDKAVVELPSPRSGRVARLFGAKGDLVKVGAPLVEFPRGRKPIRARLSASWIGKWGRGRRRVLRASGSGQGASGSAGGARAGAQARCRPQFYTRQRPRRHRNACGCGARRQEPDGGGTGRGAQGHAPRHGAADDHAHAEVVPASVTEEVDIGDWTIGQDITVRLCARSPPPARRSRPSMPGTMLQPASAGWSSASILASPSIPRAASSCRCCAMSASATRAICALASTACAPTRRHARFRRRS